MVQTGARKEGVMDDYEISAELLEQAEQAGMKAGLDAVPNPPLRFTDEFLRASAKVIAAAAYRAGQQQAAR